MLIVTVPAEPSTTEPETPRRILHFGDEIPDNVVHLDGYNEPWVTALVELLPKEIPLYNAYWAYDDMHKDPHNGDGKRWETAVEERALKTGVYVNWLDDYETSHIMMCWNNRSAFPDVPFERLIRELRTAAMFYSKVGFIFGRYPTANVVVNMRQDPCTFQTYGSLEQAALAIQELLEPPHEASPCEMARCVGDNLLSRGLRYKTAGPELQTNYPNLAWMGRPTIEQLSELAREHQLEDEGPSTFTAKCQVDGCGWVFSADTFAAADVARSDHYMTHPWDRDAYWKAWTETGMIPPGLDMPRYPAMSKTPR